MSHVDKQLLITGQPDMKCDLNFRGLWCDHIVTPINMPLRASIGPVLGRCCQHWTSTGLVLAPTGMFTGILPTYHFMNVLQRHYLESNILILYFEIKCIPIVYVHIPWEQLPALGQEIKWACFSSADGRIKSNSSDSRTGLGQYPTCWSPGGIAARASAGRILTIKTMCATEKQTLFFAWP